MTEKYADLGKIEEGVYLVNVLGVIFDPSKKKILIGRRENDPYIPKLTWCFPGGRVRHNEGVSASLKQHIKEQTGLDIEDLGTVFSRIPDEKKNFLLIYHLCEVIGGEEKAGDSLNELKWVSPEELENYFETSFDPRLKEYIENLK